MSNFRKKMHVEYKKKLYDIIVSFVQEIDEDEFVTDYKSFIERWIDRKCLPMGDFSKEDAIKEVEGWHDADI
jgi:hypothetical protein